MNRSTLLLLTLSGALLGSTACRQTVLPEGQGLKTARAPGEKTTELGDAKVSGGTQLPEFAGMSITAVTLDGPVPESLPASERFRELVRSMGAQPLYASRRFKLVHGRSPVSLDDIAQFAFVWPGLKHADAIDPIPLLNDEAALTTRDVSSLEQLLEQPDLLPYHLRLAGEELLIQYPSLNDAGTQLETKVWQRPIQTGQEANPGAEEQLFAPIPLTTLKNTVDEADLHRRLLFYRSRAEDPADARIGEAAEQLLGLLESVTDEYEASLTNWESVASLRAVALINLAHSDSPESADIVLESNGRDAYRLRVRYPSGYTEDTAIVFGEMQGSLGSRPLMGSQHEWGAAPLHLLLAVDVVPIESAQLPRK